MTKVVLVLLASALLLMSSATWAQEVHPTVHPDGRQHVKDVLRENEGYTPPENTVVYVVGGNFDYGVMQRRYMSPARTAAKRLGLPVIESTANPNGSLKENAEKIRGDVRGILASRPGVTILVSANSKGYADWYEAMVDPPEDIRRAEGRIGVFALTPNWGGAPMADKVLRHPFLQRIVGRLLSRERSPWDQRSMSDITPRARAATIAGYRGKPTLKTPTIVATAHLGRGSDFVVPLQAQIPEGVEHERWDFGRATHGSFTMSGRTNSRSTRVQMAGLLEVNRRLHR